MIRTAIAGFCGVAAFVLIGHPGEARAQQHWFFGHYDYYDGNVYYPEPRPRPRRYYVPAYPRPWFWRGVPREDIVEYEIAPNRWVRVYPDGSHEPIARPGRRRATLERAPRLREARRPAVKQAVPVPKTKPSATANTLAPTGTALEALDEIETAAPETTREVAVDRIETGSLKPVTCEEAQRIVADFGFSDVKAKTCSGKTYDIEATRDGKPFEIKLSAADGELTEVKKR